jgi:hypothetical protein
MSDATPRVEASDSDLHRVSRLTKVWLETKERVGTLEEELKAAKEAHRKVAEEDLPDAMHQAGLSEILTSDGYAVEVKSVVSATWPSADRQDKRASAIAFLTEQNALDLITAEIVVGYSRKEYDAAVEFYERARGDNRAKVVLQERVHPQTLSAWVRERMKNGLPVDFESFNVRAIMRASVK